MKARRWPRDGTKVRNFLKHRISTGVEWLYPMPQDDHEDGIQVVVFSAPGGDVSFTINGDRDTIWGTRQEMAAALGCGEENVRQHIRNLYKEGGLDEAPTSTKF